MYSGVTVLLPSAKRTAFISITRTPTDAGTRGSMTSWSMTCAGVLLSASASRRRRAAAAALGTEPASVMVEPLNTTSTGNGVPSGSNAGGAGAVVVVEGATLVEGATIVDCAAVVDDASVVDEPGVVDVEPPATAAGCDARDRVGGCELPPVTSTTSSAAAPTATAPQARPAMRRSRPRGGSVGGG